jgi:putative ABC transport system substrate-binding protein
VRKGLAETGYREGQNVELRYAGAAGRYDRLPTVAAGLVSEGANVVIAISPPGIRAAQDAAATTPIVFMLGDDPKRGLVVSLNKPAAASPASA